MFGRAVSVFKNSISKSKSSQTLSNSDRDDDNSCNESVVSSFSLASIASCSGTRHRRPANTSTPISRVSMLKRERRAHSTNREGEKQITKKIREIFLLKIKVQLLLAQNFGFYGSGEDFFTWEIYDLNYPENLYKRHKALDILLSWDDAHMFVVSHSRKKILNDRRKKKLNKM